MKLASLVTQLKLILALSTYWNVSNGEYEGRHMSRGQSESDRILHVCPELWGELAAGGHFEEEHHPLFCAVLLPLTHAHAVFYLLKRLD